MGPRPSGFHREHPLHSAFPGVVQSVRLSSDVSVHLRCRRPPPAFDEILRPLDGDGRAEESAHTCTRGPRRPSTPWDRSERVAAYPSELPPGIFARKLEALTALLTGKLGRAPRSYRAGRWGLSAAHIPVLLELGYIADCSVTPLVNWIDPGARERGQDFSIAQVRPYLMAWGDPAREGASGLLEVPVTILNTNRWMRRSPMLRAVYHALPEDGSGAGLQPRVSRRAAVVPAVFGHERRQTARGLRDGARTRTARDRNDVSLV